MDKDLLDFTLKRQEFLLKKLKEIVAAEEKTLECMKQANLQEIIGQTKNAS
jgi:flagellar biosynthesis/type III secretory pathway chaperone